MLFALAGSGALTVLLTRQRSARSLTLFGTAALMVGVAVTLLAIARASVGVLFVGTAVAGGGFGGDFQGAIRTVIPLAVAAPARRRAVGPLRRRLPGDGRPGGARRAGRGPRRRTAGDRARVRAGCDRAGRRGADRHPPPSLDRRQVVVALARGPKREESRHRRDADRRRARGPRHQPGEALLHARGEAHASSTSSATTSRSPTARWRGIRDRPIVLKRFVDGAEGEAFYQKRAPDKRPAWLRTVTLSFPVGPDRRRGRGRRRRRPRLDREPRLHRAAPAPGPLRRSRPSRRTARRPRSRARASTGTTCARSRSR